MIQTELPKSYTPAEVEDDIRRKWDKSEAFHAESDSSGGEGRGEHAPARSGEPYCILIPPPNVTAALHLGHAFNNTLQDVLVRYHRMRGCNTLWMPGTDHAGIATQTVVDKRLQQLGEPSLKDYKKRESEGGREQFIAKVQAWKDEYEATIIEQLKAMGASCDFARTRFTMDEMCAKAVREAFFQLFRDGLIYRGKRLVNWDPVTQTALADDEVEMQEVDGKFYYLRYPLVHPPSNPDDPRDCQEVTWSELAARGYPGADLHGEDENAWVTVATTRPETYLGDTAVAVNPADPRAVPLDGLMVQLPLVGRVIPIVRDDYVVMPEEGSSDPKAQFATGFLKVTPAHDPNDYDIGQRHGLDIINVMAPDASISDKHGWEDVGDAHLFVGLSREKAREKVVREFEARSLLESVRPYTHSVGHSYRSHVPIEPYLSDQWYVRVTDDRMKGAALRAMAEDQIDLTSRDRKGAEAEPNATELNPCAFFISFTTYGSWLHGDDRGSVDRLHNLPGTPILHGDEQRERNEFESLKQSPMSLGEAERSAVQEAIVEVCEYRGWRLEALHVRTNHVHVVVTADAASEKVMNDFKAYATRRLRHEKIVSEDRRVWTRHGSTRYLNDDAAVGAAARYVIDEQGEPLSPPPVDRRAPSRDDALTSRDDALTSRDREGADRVVATPARPQADAEPLPDGRGSLRQGDGELRFFPERYAKTFQQWHENLRDWCISRQLWWGHRIPVWRMTVDFPGLPVETNTHWGTFKDQFFAFAKAAGIDDDITIRADKEADIFVCTRTERADKAISELKEFVATQDMTELSEQSNAPLRFQFSPEFVAAKEAALCLEIHEIHGQDPDVLDTWFSSGLWPLSTMGWPDPYSFPETVLTSRDREGAESGDGPLPDGRGSLTLLNTFNPTSVLCTAREIITLWVSRMVMFNRYFNDGKVPFRHVYIHAMIQDGHGQKMSKSLGNGVDPRDIISTHGADALRFTLTQIATATQDVRLPVDLVCPHTGETFTPKMITTPAGHVVPAPIQTCPRDANKKMVTAYGVASGQATPTDDMPLAINASAKFDLGRNFANKLWNAARFALSNLDNGAKAHGSQSVGLGDLQLVDRWMLARLHDTLKKVEHAIANYQFNAYADAMYDLIWREFCDWYLEAIKPTVKQNADQQRVLASVLDALLRMLHPIMPFVTETLWSHVTAASADRDLDLIELPPSNLAAIAAWPKMADAAHDATAVATFERVQQLVDAIRTIRGERNIPRKQKLTLHMPPKVMSLVEQAGGVIQTMALLETVLVSEERPSGGAVPIAFDGAELYLTGLMDNEDPAALEAERSRLTKFIAEKERAINGFRQKLNNESYVSKAPAHLVEETRAKLAEAEADWDAARNALESIQASA